MALDMTKRMKLGEVFDLMNRDEDFCVVTIDFKDASSDDDNMDGAGQLEVTRT